MPDNSIQTPVWGPCLWTYLHFWSMSFPVEPTKAERLAFAQTLLAILKTLPCNICVDNVPTNLTALGFATPHTPPRLAQSPFLRNRQTLTKFIFDFHNRVSAMLGKSLKLDYDAVMADLEMARAKGCTPAHQEGEHGCTQPQYRACQTRIFLIPRNQNLEGGEIVHNLNVNF